MPVAKLTQEGIAKLRCPEGMRSIQYCDSDLPGLLLEVRSTCQDSFTWYYRYRNAASQTKYVKLGYFPGTSLLEGRKLAAAQRERIRYLGADPRAEVDAKKAIPTFSTFFTEEYLPFAKQRKRTWAKDNEYFRLRIKDELGNIKLDCLRRKQIQDFHTSLKTSGLASSTADHYLKLIKRVLGLAKSWGVITENVSKGLPLFMEDNSMETYLTDLELIRLTEILQTDHNRTVCMIIMFLLSTGARKNEALQAQWKYIDMDNRVWRIPASNSKSKKMRSLPLSDTAMSVLKTIDANRDDESEFVFVNKRTGTKYVTIQKQWERIREKSDLKHVRLHDLRHTFASYLANSGRSLFEIQTLLGHASPKVTMRYSHLSVGTTLMDATSTASEKIASAMKKTA
jgi:integrase